MTNPASGEREAIVDWARDKASLHHQFAHENPDLRTQHIALSSAYLEVAAAISRGDHLSRIDQRSEG